mgnify:CR=1 FL=1|jgi:hypothetical protein
MATLQDVSRPRAKRSQSGRIEGTNAGQKRCEVHSSRRQSYSEYIIHAHKYIGTSILGRYFGQRRA